MNLQRGDALKARFPHATGGPGKKRPVVVVQGDDYNQRLRHAVVAQVTTWTRKTIQPTCSSKPPHRRPKRRAWTETV